MLLAAALTAAICLLHVFGGGPTIHLPIQQSTLNPMVKGAAAVVWHMITVVIALSALALLWVAKRKNIQLELLVFAVFLAFIVLFLFYSISVFGNVIALPQWLLFTLPSLFIAWDWRPRKNA